MKNKNSLFTSMNAPISATSEAIPLNPNAANATNNNVWSLAYKIRIICLVCLIWGCKPFVPYPIGSMRTSSDIAATPWSDGCEDGLAYCLCPRETICCPNLVSMIFLAVSRLSAYFPYPLFMLLFLSKARNIMTALQSSVFSVWINFPELHHIHTLAGSIAAISGLVHTFFHLLR